MDTPSVRGQDEQNLYNNLASAVWMVRTRSENGTAQGTGFCIDPDGLIMTCAHCVKHPSNGVCVVRQNDTNFQNDVGSLDKSPSGPSEEKQAAKDVLTVTPGYRRMNEYGTNSYLGSKGDIPMIEIRNIHLDHGGLGAPILLPTGDVVGMHYCGHPSRDFAVHVSALRYR
jgi:hypothetical protein